MSSGFYLLPLELSSSADLWDPGEPFDSEASLSPDGPSDPRLRSLKALAIVFFTAELTMSFSSADVISEDSWASPSWECCSTCSKENEDCEIWEKSKFSNDDSIRVVDCRERLLEKFSVEDCCWLKCKFYNRFVNEIGPSFFLFLIGSFAWRWAKTCKCLNDEVCLCWNRWEKSMNPFLSRGLVNFSVPIVKEGGVFDSKTWSDDARIKENKSVDEFSFTWSSRGLKLLNWSMMR